MPRFLCRPRFRTTILTLHRLFKHRLLPARAISQANIPCVVWADDGLLFGHNANTGMLNTVEVIVPDGEVQRAADVAIESSKTEGLGDGEQLWGIVGGAKGEVVELVRRPVEEEEEIYSDRWYGGSEGYAYPNAMYLRRKGSILNTRPGEILLDDPFGVNLLIHPSSSFSFPIDNPSKTLSPFSPLCLSSHLSLDPSWDKILFPTLPTFVDTLSLMILDPPDRPPDGKEGKEHWGRKHTLEHLLLRLIMKNVFDPTRKKGFGFRTGSGMMRYRELMNSIDPANKSFIERMCLQLEKDEEGDRRRRREILERRRREKVEGGAD